MPVSQAASFNPSRLEFETLISDTSAALVAAPPEETEATIRDALDRVRLFFDADRCGLLSVSPDLTTVHVGHASYSDGVAHVSTAINLVEQFPWCARKLLLEQVPVIVPRLDDLPPEASTDRAHWIGMGTRSNLTVPITLGTTVTHVIVIHSTKEERGFSRVEVPRLRVLGELMVNALLRKQAFDAIRRSEERLERAAEAAACGLWELDVPSGHIFVTAETRRLYGLASDQEATYLAWADMLHPDDREAVTSRLGAALEAGTVFDEQYRIVLGDGEVRWMHGVGRPDGPHRLLGASVDVTARVHAEQRLHEEAARVAAAVDAAELGFSHWRVGVGPPYLDARMRSLLGIDPGEDPQAQALWLSRVHPDDREELLARRARLLDGGIDRMVIEYRYEHPSRGWIWLRHTSRHLDPGAGNGAKQLVGAVQEITDRKRREQELRAALEEVERLREQLEHENLYLRQEASRHFGSREIVGRSPAIRRALGLAEQVAPTNATVLLTGETGTGKERFASLIHDASPRRARAMVRVNCSAIPTALIESELFGREKGAYTGALSKQVGRFEVADGSTLFLDEVCDLPLEVQVKLLRVLQERTIERLGSPRPVTLDLRIIAATNRDLRQAVAEGRFRGDLFYRLNVFPIEVPPLRQRREDIPTLAIALVEEISAAMGKRFDSIAKAGLELLQQYEWPGNVRELRNVLERAMILEKGPTLHLDAGSVSDTMRGRPRPSAPEGRLEDVERDHILRVLDEAGWRIKGPDSASVRLGLKPSTLYFRMKKLGIRRPGDE